MKPIIENVNKIIYKIYKNKNPVLAEIIINWQKIVGAKYSHNTLPLKISTTKDKKQKNKDARFAETPVRVAARK